MCRWVKFNFFFICVFIQLTHFFSADAFLEFYYIVCCNHIISRRKKEEKSSRKRRAREKEREKKIAFIRFNILLYLIWQNSNGKWDKTHECHEKWNVAEKEDLWKKLQNKRTFYEFECGISQLKNVEQK